MSELRKDPVLAYIGIGSNLDDPRRQVGLAITMLNELPAPGESWGIDELERWLLTMKAILFYAYPQTIEFE